MRYTEVSSHTRRGHQVRAHSRRTNDRGITDVLQHDMDRVYERIDQRGVEVLRDQLKEAHPKITLTVFANLSDDMLEKVMSLQVSDRVTVIGTGTSHLGLDQEMYIESINHDVADAGSHVTRYVLSSVETSGIEGFISLAPAPPESQANYGPGLDTGRLGR